MRPRVAIVCASNPGNTGMYSVDLAAFDFMNRHNIDFELFTSHAPARFARYRFLQLGIDIGHKSIKRFGKLSFRRLSKISQFRKFSHILFWGDFTPNPVYGLGDFYQVDQRYDVKSRRDQSINQWARLYNFLDGRVSAKVIAAGNNFQHDFLSDKKKYDQYLHNLAENFDLILPRDPFSVSNLKSALGSNYHAKIKQGLDPAFLLTDNISADKIHKENIFCYCFGRSDIPNHQWLINSLEKSSGCRAVNLTKWLEITPSNAEEVFDRYMVLIKSSQFVVTDLYHCAINGLRLNTPVFCLGNYSNMQDGTIGDFKKKVLFEMLDLKKYYVEVDPELTLETAEFVDYFEKNIALYRENLSNIYRVKDYEKLEFERLLLSEII